MSNLHVDFLAMCLYLVPFASFFFNLLVTYFVVTSIISPQFACYFHQCFVLNFDGQKKKKIVVSVFLSSIKREIREVSHRRRATTAKKCTKPAR